MSVLIIIVIINRKVKWFIISVSVYKVIFIIFIIIKLYL